MASRHHDCLVLLTLLDIPPELDGSDPSEADPLLLPATVIAKPLIGSSGSLCSQPQVSGLRWPSADFLKRPWSGNKKISTV